jgi:hypothetical protein
MAHWGVHRPALAAWLIFQKALELGEVDRMFASLRLYYYRHWLVPAEFSVEKQ